MFYQIVEISVLIAGNIAPVLIEQAVRDEKHLDARFFCRGIFNRVVSDHQGFASIQTVLFENFDSFGLIKDAVFFFLQ